jgi:hypothetical protein
MCKVPTGADRRDTSLHCTDQLFADNSRSWLFLSCNKCVVTNSVAPEPSGSSPHSQQPANGPYPEPTGSTLHPHTISITSIMISPSHLRLGLSSAHFPSNFSKKNLYTFLSDACHMSHPPHSPWFDLPNNICGEYKIWSSSLCNFLHSPVT